MSLPIVVGDIHGEYDALMRLVEFLPHDKLCFVGDIIDRGLQSMECVSFIKDNNYKCVMGNHEMFMIESYLDNRDKNNLIQIKDKNKNQSVYEQWMHNGGENTIRSYFEKDSFQETLFFEHREWMKSLPIVIKVNSDIIISHSKYLPFFYEEFTPDVIDNILWSRLHCDHKTQNILNVHGHSVIYNLEIKNNYLNLDTGSYMCGILTACDLNDMVIYQYDKNMDKLNKFDLDKGELNGIL